MIDSRYAWFRLAVAVVLSTIGTVGMWSAAVALPAVQADFGITRANASLPFTLSLAGFAFGSALMGKLADRFGIVVTVLSGTISIGCGYAVAGTATDLWQFAFAYGLIGLGGSATFAPVMADISQWFLRRRGIAVGIASCGSYLAGTIWPPLLQYAIATMGWRWTHVVTAALCVATMLPLTLLAFHRRAPKSEVASSATEGGVSERALGLSPTALQAVLIVAGIGCCVAMVTPQVEIVAYCGDLGYGFARGAEMLSVMFALGVASRLACGLIADRIGGLKTLLLTSTLQAVALLPYIIFDDLISLYLISAAYGLFQGGIIPMYAIVVREYFSPHEAGTRVGIVVGATLFGMAIGGWLSGAIFDLTGSYPLTFVNAVLWNALNIAIIVWLLKRRDQLSRAIMTR